MRMSFFGRFVLMGAVVAGGAPAVLGGEAPSEAAAGYEQVRELARLGWLDLAGRGVAKLADPAEAALAKGWLALAGAEAEREPRRKLERCAEAAGLLEEYCRTAPGEHRLMGEARKLEAAVDDARFRASCAVMSDPRTSPEEREAVAAEVEAHQQLAINGLIAEMARAEAAYARLLTGGEIPLKTDEAARRGAFDAYWRASARCVQEMIRFGEFWPPADARQKRLGRQIAELVAGWVEKQNEKYEPLGPETAGVEMFMSYALGHGWSLAGETARAVAAFDKAIAVDPKIMADEVQARAIWTRAVYYKARTLADAAEKSGQKADWESALGALDVQLFMGLPGTDPVLAIKARILKGRCHAKLGEQEAAEEAFDRALRAADRME